MRSHRARPAGPTEAAAGAAAPPGPASARTAGPPRSVPSTTVRAAAARGGVRSRWARRPGPVSATGARRDGAGARRPLPPSSARVRARGSSRPPPGVQPRRAIRRHRGAVPMGRLLNAYRRSGADLPFGDPGRAHGSAMEGYYWRIVDASAGSVIVLLCGVCQGPEGPWARVAFAAHPGGFVRHAVIAPAAGRRDCFGVRAAGTVHASTEDLHADLGDDTWIELRTRSPVLWPRPVFGALGPAHAIPGLGQYWHPVVLAARVEGQACVGGLPVSLDGATAYVEKNWGPRFAGHWWWGHADAFPGSDATVAFAGGRLGVAGQVVAPTAVGGRGRRRGPGLP